MSAIEAFQSQLLPEKVARSRRELSVFFAFLIPLTAISYLMMFLLHLPDLFLIWTPAISSILTRLSLRMKFDDISLRFGGKKTLYSLLLVFAFTFLVAGISYGLAWSLGLAHFVVPNSIIHRIPKSLPGSSNPIFSFIWLIFIQATLGTLISAIVVAGEEIGWRGFMLTRLIEAKLPYPLLLQGLIWGLWHVPYIVSGSYGPGANPVLALGIIVFLVTITSFGYYIAWLRLRTGSIWPCLIAHGAWNSITQSAFDPVTTGSLSRLWIGESGLLVAPITLLVTISFYRLWPLREVLRKPGQPLNGNGI